MINLDRFKFRVWEKRHNKMYDQVIIGTNTAHGVWSGIDFYGNKKDPSWSVFENEFKDYVIMQSTGFKDKNGKLIFEGDLLAFAVLKDVIYEVKWVKGRSICKPLNKDDFDYGDEDSDFMISNFCYKDSAVEIIGNIYENRSLLDK